MKDVSFRLGSVFESRNLGRKQDQAMIKNMRIVLQKLVEKHKGEVPDNFPDLEELAGVGHKTASVVLAVAFKLPTFPVDTHIFR